MSKTEIIGKKVPVNQPAERLFSVLSDLSNLIDKLPEDQRDKVRGDSDTLIVQAQGMEVGIRVAERVPYSCVRYEPFGGQTLIPFIIWMHIGAGEAGASTLQIELHAELNMMMKMMIGPKLEEGVDMITERLAAGMNGDNVQ